MLKFWTNSSGSLKFDPEALHNFLKENGFGLFKTGNLNDAIFVKLNDRFVSTVTNRDIRGFCWKYIDETYVFQDPEERNQVKNAFYREKILFSNDNLLLMPEIKIQEIQDTADTSYMFFKNCILKITSEEVEKIKYEDVEGHVFQKDIIDFDLTRNDCDGIYGYFNFFIQDITENENAEISCHNYYSLKSIIGYILHRYKNPSNAKAIVLMDPYRGDGANGGTGKSLFTKAFSEVRPCAYEDGKFFQANNRFALSQVDYNTRVLTIDDIPENFDFTKLFPLITEKAVIERKYQNKFSVPFEHSPKIIITTNYVLKGLDESTKRRKIDFVLSAHYNRENTPESEYGSLFFIDWNKDQWEDFYIAMANCICTYLESGIVLPKFNVAERALRMEVHPEFIEFMDAYVKPNVKYDKREVHTNFFTIFPLVGGVELTTFRKWIKLYADAHNYKLNESHSGNVNFFEYSLA